MREADIHAHVSPVDNNGRFTEEISDYQGKYVKDADKLIKIIEKHGEIELSWQH